MLPGQQAWAEAVVAVASDAEPGRDAAEPLVWRLAVPRGGAFPRGAAQWALRASTRKADEPEPDAAVWGHRVQRKAPGAASRVRGPRCGWEPAERAPEPEAAKAPVGAAAEPVQQAARERPGPGEPAPQAEPIRAATAGGDPLAAGPEPTEPDAAQQVAATAALELRYSDAMNSLPKPAEYPPEPVAHEPGCQSLMADAADGRWARRAPALPAWVRRQPGPAPLPCERQVRLLALVRVPAEEPGDVVLNWAMECWAAGLAVLRRMLLGPEDEAVIARADGWCEEVRAAERLVRQRQPQLRGDRSSLHADDRCWRWSTLAAAQQNR